MHGETIKEKGLKDNVQNNVCQCNTIVFYLRAARFGLDIGNHQAKKFVVIKRQVKNALYGTSKRFTEFLVYNNIVKLCV